MRAITPELTAELLLHFKDSAKVASAEPFRVKTFRELVEHTAKLSFKNKDYLLFYRGQHKDFRNKSGASTYYPSIYRTDQVQKEELKNRFEILQEAGEILAELFERDKIEGFREIKRRTHCTKKNNVTCRKAKNLSRSFLNFFYTVPQS